MLRRCASLVCIALLSACSSQSAVGTKSVTLLGAGVVNDPRNKSLRFDILKFGLESFCAEVARRGIPLKLSDDHPVLGRFYATDCQSEVIDDEQRKSLVVRLQGDGFAWTNVTGKMGFHVVALVELAPDFQVAPDRAMYVYFRPRNVQSTTFETRLIESPLARQAMSLARTDANQLGLQIFRAQLERGFTVIRQDGSGQIEYGVGTVPLGVRPFVPFTITSDKQLLANDRTELHSGQQDLIGAFEVTDEGQSLTVALEVDGAPAVDIALLPAEVGKSHLEAYVSRPGAIPLTLPPLFEQSVPYGPVSIRTVPVPVGKYYLLLDNSAAVGTSAPPGQSARDDRAAKVDYAILLGKTP